MSGRGFGKFVNRWASGKLIYDIADMGAERPAALDERQTHLDVSEGEGSLTAEGTPARLVVCLAISSDGDEKVVEQLADLAGERVVTVVGRRRRGRVDVQRHDADPVQAVLALDTLGWSPRTEQALVWLHENPNAVVLVVSAEIVQAHQPGAVRP